MCRDIISTLNKRPYLFVDTSLSRFIYLPVPCCAKLVYFTSPSGASLSLSLSGLLYSPLPNSVQTIGLTKKVIFGQKSKKERLVCFSGSTQQCLIYEATVYQDLLLFRRRSTRQELRQMRAVLFELQWLAQVSKLPLHHRARPSVRPPDHTVHSAQHPVPGPRTSRHERVGQRGARHWKQGK